VYCGDGRPASTLTVCLYGKRENDNNRNYFMARQEEGQAPVCHSRESMFAKTCCRVRGAATIYIGGQCNCGCHSRESMFATTRCRVSVAATIYVGGQSNYGCQSRESMFATIRCRVSGAATMPRRTMQLWLPKRGVYVCHNKQ
jgi:hypothetical protein